MSKLNVPCIGTISNVFQFNQGVVILYAFPLSGETLLKLGRVNRLYEKQGGIQRPFDEKHAAQMAVDMNNPEVIWAQSLLVYLAGPDGCWEYKDGEISYGEGFYLDLDDGQHRFSSAGVIDKSRLAEMEFLVSATQGLTFQQRVEIFEDQNKAKKIGNNSKLESKDMTGRWRTSAQRLAYMTICRLAEDDSSPLKGRIIIDDSKKKRIKETYGDYALAASSLMGPMGSLFSRKSIIAKLTEEDQIDFVVRYLSIVAQTWSKEWNDKDGDSIIADKKGISALLHLPNLGSGVGTRLKTDGLDNANLKLILGDGYRARFKWNLGDNAQRDYKQIVSALDSAIARGYKKK